jgi:hypothetical protein
VSVELGRVTGRRQTSLLARIDLAGLAEIPYFSL